MQHDWFSAFITGRISVRSVIQETGNHDENRNHLVIIHDFAFIYIEQKNN